ncbi:unnamed protein product [Cylicocyclus nassatus]|uniref:Abnormal cell migration protein 18-like fibronectin type I domain-containing protein n=1 Tax=Cylicocyclus nassatus TaxID=53992 RepID=A0AA36GW05_CYLNA|nr:unnamed protein product [Cylicocyclus nassatus]
MSQYIVFALLLSCISIYATTAAIFDAKFTKPYVLKKTWVENFVKFQYIFEGRNATAKIVPVGCVPSNQDDGEVLKVGGTFADKDFEFACQQSEDGVLSYEAVACVDAHGKRMQLGEMRKLANGTVILHCNLYGGALKKVVERAAGCYYNETIYGEDEKWIEPLIDDKSMRRYKKVKPIKAKLSGNTSELTGRLMECFRPHYSYYESHLIGCAVGNIGIRFEETMELGNGKILRCVQDEEGVIKLVNVELDELSCKLDNQTYAHLAKWKDEGRAAEMQCSYGHLKKTGCIMSGKSYGIGQEVQLTNGCIFLCHPQSNVYICDQHIGNWTVEETKNQTSSWISSALIK